MKTVAPFEKVKLKMNFAGDCREGLQSLSNFMKYDVRLIYSKELDNTAAIIECHAIDVSKLWEMYVGFIVNF